MPWNVSEKLPPSAEKLKGHSREIFVAAANAALKQYEGDEGRAIATGLAAVKNYKEKLKKSETEVEQAGFAKALNELITKFFGSSSQEQKVEVIKASEEMVSYEVVYEPFTKDAHGQWMSDKTLTKACENFNKNLEKGVVKPNLFHLENTDTFTIEDTWIQKELDVVVESTGEKIKAGTWIAKIKYNSDDLWTLKKSGIIGGVSIGARANVNKETGEITNVTFEGDS